MMDKFSQQKLSDHCAIHLIELSKWNENLDENRASQDEKRWYFFFKEARNRDQLPEKLKTPEMEQAMTVLERFSEKEADYYHYLARQDYLREQATIKSELEQALQEKQVALKESDQLREESDRLQALLKKAGIKY
ncbi:MAG: hypothetical protein GY786_00475 [Proteobacteria bacterium]|nr:hypothetical protein [Pseudomonadota bacterium]